MIYLFTWCFHDSCCLSLHFLYKDAAGRRMQFFHLIFMEPGHRTLAFSPLLYLFFCLLFLVHCPQCLIMMMRASHGLICQSRWASHQTPTNRPQPHTLNCLVSADALAEVGQKILVLSQHFAWLPGEFLLFLPNVFCQSRHGIVGRHSIREFASFIIWTLPPSTGTLWADYLNQVSAI